MLKKSRDMKRKFTHKFDYAPKTPFDVLMENEKASNEYCRVLQKCIDDNFDYTIELYGTVPRTSEDLPNFIID